MAKKNKPQQKSWEVDDIHIPKNLQDLIDIQKQLLVALAKNEIKAAQVNAAASMMRVLVPLVKETVEDMGDLGDMSDEELAEAALGELDDDNLIKVVADQLNSRDLLYAAREKINQLAWEEKNKDESETDGQS